MPVFTWTGGYVLTAGYGDNAPFYTLAVGTGSTFRTSDGNIGSTLGYNLQSGSMVYGLETDLSMNWLRGTNSAAAPCASCDAIPGSALRPRANVRRLRYIHPIAGKS